MRFKTRCAGSSHHPDRANEPVNPPIVASSTFRFATLSAMESYFAGEGGHLYSRLENPTVEAAEAKLADLEGAERCVMFSSGMAAISALMFSLGGSGRTIGIQRAIYGGAVTLSRDWLPRFGMEVRPFDLAALVTPHADDFRGLALLYLETPINPTLENVLLQPIATAAAEAGVPIAVDGTFATPAQQRPLSHGCRYVVHSCTKYLGGHSDLTGGAVVGSVTDMQPLQEARKVLGGCMDPFTAFLLLRGMRTLAVRMEAHSRNAEAVARALRDHPLVNRVCWPGFERTGAVADQLSAGGGMVSFDVEGGEAAAIAIHDRLKHFIRGGSLGGIESLVTLPSRTSHRGMSKEERSAAGISDSLLRLSVGLEDPQDLVQDLIVALDSL